MIIAFAGKKFAGKDTAAEVFIKKHGFVAVGLADELKDICSVSLNINRQDMDNPSLKEVPFTKPIILNDINLNNIIHTLKHRKIPVTSDQQERILKHQGKELTSIRNVLQYVGTEVIRTEISDNIWLELFDRKVLGSEYNNIVITDARFKNERDHLKNMGAILCYIQRKGNESSDTHKSENQLGTIDEYDIIINNDSDIASLHFDLSQWYSLRKK
jgi:hypothetical protein